MNIVHISTTDYGGAYRAADRISSSLNSVGLNSMVIVRTKSKTYSNCTEFFSKPYERFFSRVKNVINLVLSPNGIVTDLFGTDITKSDVIKNADVIVLHWVNSFISYKVVKKLIQTNKKIVWVIHDMWLFTGGCHYTKGCNNYLNHCINCPLGNNPISKQIAKINAKLKRLLFSNSNIEFIAVSDWIRDTALKSDIMAGLNIKTIYNPIDTSVFKPVDDTTIDDLPSLNNKKIILFGADKATKNSSKGFKYIIEALKKLDGNRYIAVCFGNAPEETQISLPNIDIIYTGNITNDEMLIKLYSKADVMVTPSLQEAFGYTCCEALSCATPVVAFNVGGLSEQIIHLHNGYLAKAMDTDDLIKGIKYCIDNKSQLSENARNGVLKTNSYTVIGNKYKSIFSD